MILRYCAKLKAVRYESKGLNRIVADKSGHVIVALLESGTSRPISRPENGRFLSCFTGENQFLFYESKVSYHGIQHSKRYPHPRWEMSQIIKIAHF